jgi:hypothetical protein
MSPLECHTVARIRCDEFAIRSLARADVRLAEQTRLASVRHVAKSLPRAALDLLGSLRRAVPQTLRV